MVEGIRATVVDYAHAALTYELDYYVRFCSKTMMMAIADWATNDFDCPPETLAGYMVNCVPGTLRVLLDESAARNTGGSNSR